MVDVDRSVIARIDRQGQHFEILVDCDKALEFRQGKKMDINDIVAVDDVFFDVKKGLKASEKALSDVFGTSDVASIFETIIRKGEVQLTAKHLAKIREEKRRQIVNIIHRNAIDSKTRLPHPVQRIERAMEEAKVRIDPNKSAEEQVANVVDKLSSIIPIKFEKRELEIKIPSRYAARCFHVLKKYSMKRDEWLGDGSLLAIVEIPAGIQDEFFSELNQVAHGEVESKIIRTL